MNLISHELKTRIIDKIVRVLHKNHSHPEKTKTLDSKSRLNFACPYCGDSSDNNRKKRGNLYWNDLFFHCYNCSAHTSLDAFLTDFEHNFEGGDRVNVINFINENRKLINAGETLDFYLFDKINEMALTFDELSLGFNIYPLNQHTYRAFPYLRSRMLHNKLERFAYDPRRKDLYIFNLNIDKKIVGFQVRNLEGIGPKYTTWNIERIYNKLGLDLDVQGNDLDSLNKISMLFGILQVNFSSRLTIFEGPMDAMFMSNSLGLTGVKKQIVQFDELPNVRYFFDNDKEGKLKMIEKLKMHQSVFMWSKFCKDFNIPYYGKKLVKDLNDLVIFEYINKTGCLSELDKYFTNNPLDIIYI